MLETSLPTVIFRHRRENLKKCSLQPIKGRADFWFFTYPTDKLPLLPGYIMLTLGVASQQPAQSFSPVSKAPLLSKSDCSCGLLLIDATWRYAEKIERQLSAQASWIKRSLPPVPTCYPRKQLDCSDPCRGLASIEALYLAYYLLGRKTDGLLDHYYWKEPFLARVAEFFCDFDRELESDEGGEHN
ncbi:MAG: hypothetical protein AAF443_06040 [Chlamydiota bacterium]